MKCLRYRNYCKNYSEEIKQGVPTPICIMTKERNIFEEINEDLKAVEEQIMADENESLSATEIMLDSILVKGLSIVDKFLTRVEKKMDDEEFMNKLEKNIEVNIKKVTIETKKDDLNKWCFVRQKPKDPDFNVKTPEVDRD